MSCVMCHGPENEWFKGYLSHRTQKVKVNGILSGAAEVTCGVPQGSTLGPLLFLIYVNDIVDHIPSELLLFADDTVIYSIKNTHNETVEDLQNSINQLMLWTQNSKLTINAAKSKIMTIWPGKGKDRKVNIRQENSQTSNISTTKALKMGNTVLEEVKVYKYQGLKIDNELKFKIHVRGIIKNVAHKAYLLAKIRKSLTVKAAKDVFKATILPLFDVCDEFYDCVPSLYLKRLQSLQNRIMRIVYKLKPRDNTDELHLKMNVQKLADRRLTHMLKLIGWLVTEPGLSDTRNLSTRLHDVNRRLIKLPRPRKELYKRSFYYKAGSIWNSLPTYVHKCQGQDKLKACILDLMKKGQLSAVR